MKSAFLSLSYVEADNFKYNVMMFRGYFIILIFCIEYSIQTGSIEEFCYEENFVASCPADQVIVMDTARFGRIKTNRCINLSDDERYGCYANVIGILDKRCSGKQNCNVVVNKNNLGQPTSCNQQMFPYLEVSYTCTPVLQIESHQCSIQIGNKDATPTKLPPPNLQGSILPTAVLRSDCGREFEPLLLEALPGQEFRVIIVDFYANDSSRYASSQDCSVRYGQILDIEEENTRSICSSQRRESELMVSEGHRLQIKFDQSKAGRFMLKYEVRNCPTTLNMVNGWFQSDGDVGEAGCHNNDHVWHLTCRGSVWQGLTGDCLEKKGSLANFAGIDITHDVIIMGASALVLFISALIVCIGCCYMGTFCCRLCLKRKKPKRGPPQEVYYTGDFRFMRACDAPGTSTCPREQGPKPGEQETSFIHPTDNRYRSLHPGGMQNRPLPEIPEYDVPAQVHRAADEEETLLVRGLPNNAEPDRGNVAPASVEPDELQRIPTEDEVRRMQSMVRAYPNHMTLFSGAPHSRMPKNPRLYASTMGRVLREHPNMVNNSQPINFHQRTHSQPPPVAQKPQINNMAAKYNPDIKSHPMAQSLPPPDITTQIPDVARGTEMIYTEDSDSDTQVPIYQDATLHYPKNDDNKVAMQRYPHSNDDHDLPPPPPPEVDSSAMFSSPPPQDVTVTHTAIPPQTYSPLDGAQVLPQQGQGEQSQGHIDDQTQIPPPDSMFRSLAHQEPKFVERPLSV